MSIDLEDFWDANAESGNLQIPQCSACSAWNWYPLPVCRACGGESFELKAVGRTGTLHSWTRVHRNFSGLEMPHLPYIVALVSPDDAAGVKIVSLWREDDTAQPAIGMAVSLEAGEAFGRHFWECRPV